MAAVAGEVLAHFGRIDTVVANAGVATGGPFLDSDPDAFDRVIHVNLLGSIATARAFLPALVESRGYFLQIASLAAITPAPMMAAYCASKSGVEAFAHSLRAELGYKGVKVGVGYLSWTDTDMVRGADEDEALRAVAGPAAVADQPHVSAGAGRRPYRRRDRTTITPCVRAVVAARDAAGARVSAVGDRRCVGEP